MIPRRTGRTATPQTCRKCGTPVLVGPDHDVAALIVTVEADPLPEGIDEANLIDAGRSTYTARAQRDGVALWYRDSHHRPSRAGLTIHAEHACPYTVEELPL